MREWDRILLSMMGSPDGEYGRQSNGMGGGVSSLSKVVVVGLPQDRSQNADVEYTFVQVGVRDSTIDYSGNCGNLSSMVGIFAVDEGLCPVLLVNPVSNAVQRASVRAFNTNTSKVQRAGAVRMGLDPSAQAQPKVAVLRMPEESDTAADIVAFVLSMGVVHKAVPTTLGLCLGVASNIPNSIPWRTMKEDGKNSTHTLRMRFPGGVSEVSSEFRTDGNRRSCERWPNSSSGNRDMNESCSYAPVFPYYGHGQPTT
ncbi:hypothetical protein K488DRAFT_72660 [Vararia minispora EC-137]|uniref:Uncharacterized protein n=1 Tax=Vararia minispora EC-137 TaxID=1314806 RepID=A0ACB8QDF3_9AGAM|nr:hypothetical protein K488DRAFT_72660 [Vararia minispora EC-137]